jgi:hypothetical protein
MLRLANIGADIWYRLKLSGSPVHGDRSRTPTRLRRYGPLMS